MINKWNIYYLNLDPTKGSEQKGKRPVLVISNDAVNDNLPIFTCIPFSYYKKGSKIYPTEILISSLISGLPNESVLMVQQIRTVSKERISGEKISSIVDDEMKKIINQRISEYFDLWLSRNLCFFHCKKSLVYDNILKHVEKYPSGEGDSLLNC